MSLYIEIFVLGQALPQKTDFNRAKRGAKPPCLVLKVLDQFLYECNFLFYQTVFRKHSNVIFLDCIQETNFCYVIFCFGHSVVIIQSNLIKEMYFSQRIFLFFFLVKISGNSTITSPSLQRDDHSSVGSYFEAHLTLGSWFSQ